MIDVSGGSIYDILPPNLHTPMEKALAAAVKKMFDGVVVRLPLLAIYSEPSKLDGQMCDFLALSFNISAYNQDYDIETKRELVQSALRVSATKGTATALRDIITSIHGGARLSEWFDYGGTPFHFKIEIDTFKRGIDEAGYNKIMEIIGAYKRTSAILEAIIINLKAENRTFIGGVSISGDAAFVMPEVVTSLLSRDTLYTGACNISGESTVTMPEITQLAIGRCSMTIAAVTVCGEHAIIKPI